MEEGSQGTLGSCTGVVAKLPTRRAYTLVPLRAATTSSSRDGEAGQCDYEWSRISPSVALLETIGEYEDIEYSRESSVLAEPRYHYCDSDALDTLIESDNPPTITLTLGAYTVATAKNSITVTTDRTTPPRVN